jgi:hypothetical protein
MDVKGSVETRQLRLGQCFLDGIAEFKRQCTEMEFEFRANIKFDPSNQFTGLVFDKFLPLVGSKPPVQLGQTKFKCALVVDPKEHRGWVSDIDFSEINRHHGVLCRGIFVFLSCNLEAGLADALVNLCRDERTREFGVEILKAVQIVHDMLIDLARNELQFAEIPLRQSTNNGLQQDLYMYNIRWKCDEGWRLLTVSSEPILIEANIRRGICPEDWQRLDDALQKGKFRVRPHRRLIANAFAHYEKNDLRAAIIEAVAAWEMVLNDEATRRLAEAQVCYDPQEWKNLIEKAGLRASTKLFMTLVHSIPILAQYRGTITEAIELRNTVVHNGQQRIDQLRVLEFLNALRTVCFACEDVPANSFCS